MQAFFFHTRHLLQETRESIKYIIIGKTYRSPKTSESKYRSNKGLTYKVDKFDAEDLRSARKQEKANAKKRFNKYGSY